MMLNRVSLNTIGLNRIGLNRIGKPSRASSDRPYIDPEVLASLRAVCICYGKSNDDPDRAVVKNLVDPDNPFVISNAAYDKMSSYGGYEFAKFDNELDWYLTPDNGYIDVVSRNGYSITLKNLSTSNYGWYFQNSTVKEFITKDIPFKVKANKSIRVYWDMHSYKSNGEIFGYVISNIILNPNEDTSINLRHLTEEELTELDADKSRMYYLLWFDLSALAVDEEVTIEMLPQFEGAFVTDGIDDLITSTKTVQEMLGGSTEFTAVSMIHLISPGQDVDGAAYTNYIRTSDNYWTSNRVSNVDKTGIYGYSFKQSTPTVINNILGDKGDYTTDKSPDTTEMFRANFSVEGFEHAISGAIHVSSVAWYWTVIANKILTTDQINQVIAYFNLDRTLNPDILCNTIKQGITNENHAEFGDKLIDFSGNGRDIQLNNIAWKGDSGIGKYETELSNTSIWTQSKETTSSPFSSSYNGLSGWIVFANTELTNSADMPSFKIQVKGLLEGQELIYRYYDSNGQSNVYSMGKDGEYTLPSDVRTAKPQTSNTSGFQVVKNETNIITITQIPSHAGALCLDGVNDFGKVTGMPIYKDYTVVADYIRTSTKEDAQDSPILSKSQVVNNGAFVFNYLNINSALNSYSFGTNNMLASISDSERKIYYQSKYVNEGKSINSGTGTDYDSMWLGIYRDNTQIFLNGAIYSLMTFPYSMSEFLIERQLKKHKLGTLYPNMVEFRPIVKSNLPYSSISYSVNPGEYISVDSMVTITITLPNTSDKLMEVSCNAISDISISGDNGVYEITGKVGKSPQKINMIISSYLTMLSNSTLISNETLIKNE